MKTKGSLLFLSLFSLSAAYAVPLDNPKQNKHFSPLRYIKLGDGYLDNSSLPKTNTCVKEMQKNVSSLQKNIKFTQSIDINALAATLNHNLHPSKAWGKFFESPEMYYINAVKNDDYTIIFNYQNKISANVSLDSSEYYGINALRKGAAAAYNESEVHFIKLCGDSYIQNLNLGAVLDVSLLIHFSSLQQKKKFEASITENIGNIFNAPAALRNEIQNAPNVTIDVIAFQGGGNPTYLDEIFEADPHIVTCNLENLDKCTKMIDNITDYAQANGKWSGKGFANQVKLNNGQLEADDLYPINLNEKNIFSYEDSFGLSVKRVEPSQEILNARNRLNTLYNENLNNAHFFNLISQSVAFTYLDKTIKKAFQTEKTNLNKNLSMFQDEEFMDCFYFSTQKYCSRIVKDLESSLIPINTNYFNLLKGSYFVNINNSLPAIFVPKDLHGNMEVYTTNLQLYPESIIMEHSLGLIPSSDWSYIRPAGEYSTYNDRVVTRYYLGVHGTEDFVYQSSDGIAYFSVIPFDKCVNGACSKIPTPMKIIPF